MYDNQAFKNYFAEKRYLECVQILKNRITDILVNRINQIDPTFAFTTVSGLISGCDFYLGDSTIARQLKIALIQETALEQLEYLLSIFEQHGIR